MRSLMIALIVVLMTACGSSSSGPEATEPAAQDGVPDGPGGTSVPPPPPNLKIDLPEITGTCLNLEEYFNRIRSLPPTTSVRRVTKEISFKATGNNIPRNFLLRLAAGNFQMNDMNLAEVPEFVEMRQEACSKISLRIEGRDEAYSIIRAKPDSLTLENEWDNQMTITWKAVNKLQFESVSLIGDYLCDPNSRGRLQTISEITWGNPDIFTPVIAASVIDKEYLDLVIEATAYPTSVFSTNNELVADRLKELHARPVRADLLQCY